MEDHVEHTDKRTKCKHSKRESLCIIFNKGYITCVSHQKTTQNLIFNTGINDNGFLI